MSDYAALAQLAGTGAQIKAQSDLNKRNREWQEHVYQIQKKDNIAFWNMHNQYNRPEAQMQRFEAAGLNPHLIYGQGNPGNSQSAVPTPDMQNIPQRAPDFQGGVGATIAAIYDTRIKQAQANNLEAQNTVLKQEAIYKKAQTFDTLFSGKTKEYDLQYKKDIEHFLKSIVGDEAELKHWDAEQAPWTRSYNYDRQRLDVEETKQRIINMGYEGDVKKWHSQLADEGMTPNDLLYWRVIQSLLNRLPNNLNPLNIGK